MEIEVDHAMSFNLHLQIIQRGVAMSCSISIFSSDGSRLE